MAPDDAIHQDVSITNSPPHLPDRSDSRVTAHWLPPFPTAVPVATYCAATRTPITLPAGEAKAPPTARPWLLFRDVTHRRRPHWIMDALVPRRTRSVVLHRLLDARGQEQVDPARTRRVLGSPHQSQRRRLDQTACPEQTTEAMERSRKHADR